MVLKLRGQDRLKAVNHRQGPGYWVGHAVDGDRRRGSPPRGNQEQIVVAAGLVVDIDRIARPECRPIEIGDIRIGVARPDIIGLGCAGAQAGRADADAGAKDGLLNVAGRGAVIRVREAVDRADPIDVSALGRQSRIREGSGAGRRKGNFCPGHRIPRVINRPVNFELRVRWVVVGPGQGNRGGAQVDGLNGRGLDGCPGRHGDRSRGRVVRGGSVPGAAEHAVVVRGARREPGIGPRGRFLERCHHLIGDAVARTLQDVGSIGVGGVRIGERDRRGRRRVGDGLQGCHRCQRAGRNGKGRRLLHVAVG